LFNCSNGTVDLRSGKFRPHDADHLLTKQSSIAFDPKADCPKWKQFILDVMDGKEHMSAYLARCCGYSMSAETGEQCVFIPWGQGGTGKSTFLGVMRIVLGDYCQQADAEMFMVKRGDGGQPFEMAGKEGARMLMAIETEEGKRLALAKMKRMSGQDPVSACYKFQNQYSFIPQWKIWLATNDAPDTRADDDAWWDRAKPIPFNVKFRNTERQIKDYHEILVREEGSGILNWCLAGYGAWKQSGLQHPDDVAVAAAEWRDRDDYLQRFLDERVIKTSEQAEFVSKTVLFERFSCWSDVVKEGRGMNDKRFSEAMRRKGFKDDVVKQNGKAIRVWVGLKLVNTFSNDSERRMPDFAEL